MPTAISLFSGAGGCSLGLKQAGFDIALAVDEDADACETYALNFGRESLWRADLSKVPAEQVLERSRLRGGMMDLIVGGPPCQGVSSAGAKDWSDPRNVLLTKFVEFVTVLRPTWFVMENVEGLLTAKEGFFITEAITRFLEAGYWVRVTKVYMEQYGLPQQRKRVFVVGNLEQCAFTFPPTRYQQARIGSPVPKSALRQLAAFEQPEPLSILDAIGDLPPPSASSQVFYERPARHDYQAKLRRTDGRPLAYHRLKPLKPVYQERVKLIGQGETMKHLPGELQHPSFTRRAFRRVMDGTPSEQRGGAPAGIKRLYAAKPSLTITSASSAEFIHPMEDRLLTPRECARIQSFPDWFEFSGSWSSIATQIGNAVPPLFMEALARHIVCLARWHRGGDTRGRWLGIDATKANGMSPVLVKMLSRLEEKTYAFSR